MYTSNDYVNAYVTKKSIYVKKAFRYQGREFKVGVVFPYDRMALSIKDIQKLGAAGLLSDSKFPSKIVASSALEEDTNLAPIDTSQLREENNEEDDSHPVEKKKLFKRRK